MNLFAPIVLFVYNRPSHTRKTVESLLLNAMSAQSKLYIYSDGPKKTCDIEIDVANQSNVDEVRSYVDSIQGFREVIVIKRDANLGLARSVIEGVSEVIAKHGRAIVMEDDMICSKNFLDFMNKALNSYQNNENVFSISGYAFPVSLPIDYSSDIYLYSRTSSWGWATWSDRWSKVDWLISDWSDFSINEKSQSEFNKGGEDLTGLLSMQMNGKIDSWSIRFDYACYKNKAYCLYPRISKIFNIGTDGSGVHFTNHSNEYDVILDNNEIAYVEKNVAINENILDACYRFFTPPHLIKNKKNDIAFIKLIAKFLMALSRALNYMKKAVK